MRVNQDSRTIKKGEWFVAVKGDKFDGHKFISEALGKGAAGILEVNELYDLARKKLAEVRPEVIAVTGSYGKTTTKEMIAKVLNPKFEVLCTKGNLNTPLGVAMEVVNNLKPRHQVLIAEVGMDRLGEIRQTGSIIHPRIGIITAIGEMHLEKLGTLGNIRRAKGELLESLPEDGIAVLNEDDPNVVKLAENFKGRKVWYGLSRKNSLRLRLLGEAYLSDALAAAKVGWILGVSPATIATSLFNFRPQKGRLSVRRGRGGITVLDDAYNAGPRSVSNALAVLGRMSAKRKVAILGDMLELGPLEDSAHERVILEAARAADLLVPVGERMRRAAKKSKLNFSDLNLLSLTAGDLVLVKGSHGMKMDQIVQRIIGNVD